MGTSSTHLRRNRMAIVLWPNYVPNNLIISEGKLSGDLNRAGIKYYNNLINKLLPNGHE